MAENLRILLIEDDNDHADLFTRCATASALPKLVLQRVVNLREASSAISDNAPSLIVTDLGLAETQGLDTLREVLGLRPGVPVVVLTSSDDLRFGLEALRMGAQDYLFKGDLVPRVLERTVRYAIERAQLTSELSTAHAALASFAGAAAHDLRAPLRRIRSHLEVVQEQLSEQPKPVDPTHLEHVLAAAERLSNLVGSLLEFSKSGERIAARQEIPVDELVEEAKSLLAEPLKEADAIVALVGRSAIIRGNRALLLRVIQNLIDNAIAYVDGQRPEVSLSVQENHEGWVVAVQDNAVGIEASNLERIFEPLQRLHSADVYEGSGIGLATCRRIISAHGGKIWAESTVGQGSKISFTLPRGELGPE